MRPELEEALNHLRAAAAIIKRLDAIDNPPFETTDEFMAGPYSPDDDNKQSKAFWDQSFEQWWKYYWYKDGKDKARKAYEKRAMALMDSTKRGAPEVVGILVQYLIDYKKRFEPTDAWQLKTHLHASTWLNQSRWTDQAPEPDQAKPGREVGYDRL